MLNMDFLQLNSVQNNIGSLTLFLPVMTLVLSPIIKHFSNPVCISFCLQFMVLLVLRHTLPIIISGAGEYSATLFTVSFQILLVFICEYIFEKRK